MITFKFTECQFIYIFMKDCIYTCLHEIMMDRCGCTDIKFPFQVEKLHFPCSAIASDKGFSLKVKNKFTNQPLILTTKFCS